MINSQQITDNQSIKKLIDKIAAVAVYADSVVEPTFFGDLHDDDILLRNRTFYLLMTNQDFYTKFTEGEKKVQE